jgi:1,4-dihydroxy-2-naphthoate octaprenyltransferase
VATPAEWVEGARPRTLFLAVAPVIAGTGAAAHEEDARWGRAILALTVALALQIGVNYANDYSDGLRGADADRVGPQRLVGSGAARPTAVLAAALACFALAAAVGSTLAALSSWWILLPGAAALVAAWTYTGGPLPYGYRALGEPAVFVFFGLVAVIGTAYVQVQRFTGAAVAAAVPIGLLACAVLVANNLRDIPGDIAVRKRTVAVLLGESATRRLYQALLAAAFLAAVLAAAALPDAWLLLVLLAVPLAALVAQPVRRGATGLHLVATLRGTGQLTLVVACLLAAGLAVRAG